MTLMIWIAGFIGMLAGGWRGMLLGLFIGYLLSRMRPRGEARVSREDLAPVQEAFLESTFAVMGAMCKADGQVSAEEIRVAEDMFERLRLSADARERAITAFNRGKSPGFDLDAAVRVFAQISRGQRVLHQMFIHVQLAALAADGSVHPAEHALLLRIAEGLGLSAAEVESLEALLRGGHAGSSAREQASALDDAYRVLGVTADASDAEVKRAYRLLMSQNHPDKLAAKGLPESMRAMAEEKTRAITAAYDRIDKARRASA